MRNFRLIPNLSGPGKWFEKYVKYFLQRGPPPVLITETFLKYLINLKIKILFWHLSATLELRLRLRCDGWHFPYLNKNTKIL